MDDEELRRLVHFHLLLSIYVLFANAAIPLVLPRKFFVDRKVLQAVVDCDSARVSQLKLLELFRHCRQLHLVVLLVIMAESGFWLLSPVHVYTEVPSILDQGV